MAYITSMFQYALDNNLACYEKLTNHYFRQLFWYNFSFEIGFNLKLVMQWW